VRERVCVCVCVCASARAKVELVRERRFYIYPELFLPHNNRRRRRRREIVVCGIPVPTVYNTHIYNIYEYSYFVYYTHCAVYVYTSI